MPLAVENKLKARASRKGFKGKRWRAYVYGTMQKRGLLESPVEERAVEFGLPPFRLTREQFKQRFGKYPEEVAPSDEEIQQHRKVLKKIAGIGLLGAGAVAAVRAAPVLPHLARGALSALRQRRSPNLLARIHPRLVELFEKIDLGERQTKSDCMPCKPGEIRYPTLYIYGRETPINIPKTGKALIDYRVRNRSMNQNQDEPEKYSTDIEVHAIEPISDRDLKQKAPKEGEAARLMLQDLRRITGFGAPGGRALPISFDDPRKRNSMGEFVGNETEGIDPNSMAAAYGPPAVQPVSPMTESHVERIKRFFGKRREAAAAA